jgi:hypothetical protein
MIRGTGARKVFTSKGLKQIQEEEKGGGGRQCVNHV